ncbi:MAG: hypothetical protein ACI4SS_07185, partial [Clostridia bacterium]
MKKITAMMIAAVMLLGLIPCVSFASGFELSAERAFSWNFASDAQNGSLPTAVSWGDQRACFMSFKVPDEVIAMKDKNIKVTAELTANMTFNNGRKAGQAPIVTIIAADAEAINSVSLTGGAATTEALKAAWSGGKVLGTFDTLNDDISPELDLTSIVSSGAESVGLYITCRQEDGYFTTAGIVNFNSPKLSIEVNEIT